MEEEKREVDGGLFVSRSYLVCLSEGIKLPTRHILSLLRFLYPSLSACALTAALWGVFFNQMSVAWTQWMDGDGAVALSFLVIMFLLLVLLSMLSGSFYLGNVMTAVARFADAGRWPVLRFGSLRREIFRTSLRAFNLLLVGQVFKYLVMVPVVWALGMCSVWTWVAVGGMWLAFGVPYCMTGMDYMLDGRCGFIASLKRMKDGYRHWTMFFIILFCSGLLVEMLVVVAWLPAAILSYAGHESFVGVLAGDATDLPSYIPALTVLFFMLAAVLTCIFRWLVYFPLAFLYGSIEARRCEKAFFEEEEHRLNDLH